MPFCTACGKQNPDDARFCTNCGTRLAGSAHDAGVGHGPAGGDAAPAPEESRATVNIGVAGESKTDTSDRQLNPVDAAAVDALPDGHALLVVQRGPGSGSRFVRDAD